MYNTPTINNGTLRVMNAKQAETIEKAIARKMNNQEPLEGTSPLIYQEREEGIQAAYNIRTDRFEVALDGKEAIQKSEMAKREMKIGEKTYDTMNEQQQKEFNTKYPQNKHAQTKPSAEGADK